MSVVEMEHAVSFRGAYAFGVPVAVRTDSATVVVAEPLLAHAEAAGLLEAADDVVVLDRRPDAATVSDLAGRLANAEARVVRAIGDGALLDAAKLAARAASGRGDGVALVLVPVGAEPYRAVARFAVVDDAGERPTVVDERFGDATVLVVPELLSRQPHAVREVQALDTLVHTVETLLSRAVDPMARALAMTAAFTARHGAGEPPERLVVAAFLATEAFSTTRLGLAHALASPLGTEVGVTHDTINGILGPTLVAFWGDGAQGLGDVAAALGVPARADAVAAVLDERREAAGLPAGLQEAGIGWEQIERVLPRAARSSGLPFAPRPVDAGELERFARLAWERSDRQGGDAWERWS